MPSSGTKCVCSSSLATQPRLLAPVRAANCVRAGIGDRVRGMMFLLRVAIASRRVLLLKWSHPIPLEHFFKPSLIDWRADVKGMVLPPAVRWFSTEERKGQTVVKLPNGTGALDLAKQSFDSGWHDVQVATIQTNMPAYFPVHVPSLNDRSPMFMHCLFKFLFSFSEEAEEAGKQFIQQRYGASPYPAAHLRLGQSIDEGPRVDIHDRGFDEAKAVSCAASCSANLSYACSGVVPNKKTPLLVVTDRQALREDIQAGKYPLFASLPFKRTFHLDLSTSRNITEHLTTAVELYALAHASSLIVSHSGFSNVALWHSGSTCYKDMAKCSCGGKHG